MRKILGYTWKIGRWVLLVLGILILLLVGTLYYFTATDSGYQKLPRLITKFTPYRLTSDALSGNLFTEQRWKNLHFQGAGVDFRAAEFSMHLRGGALFKRHVWLQGLTLNNATLQLPASREDVTPPSSGGINIPSALPDIYLPVTIDIEKIAVNHFTIKNPSATLVTIHSADVNLHGEGQSITLKSNADVAQADNHYVAKLDAKATLGGDYPLALTADAQLNLAHRPPETLNLTWQQSLVKPQVAFTAKGWLAGTASINGAIDLAQQNADVTTKWQNINLNAQQLVVPEGTLTLKGPFSELIADLKTQLSGSDIPDVAIAAQSQIDVPKGADTTLDIKTLDGSIHTTAKTAWAQDVTWQVDSELTHLDLSKYRPELDGNISATLASSGHSAAGGVQAVADLVSLSGSWMQQPLKGSASLSYEDASAQIKALDIHVGDNVLTANGEVTPSEVHMETQLQAPQLAAFWHGLSGAANLNARLNGGIDNPMLVATADWNKLTFTQNGQALVASPKGMLTANGNFQALAVKVDASASGASIPQSSLAGEVQLSTTAVKNIDLMLNTLGGHVALKGNAEFSPQVNWHVTGDIAHLQPQRFVPSLRGNISAQLKSDGQVIDGEPQITALLDNLSGTWQGQPLSGKADAAVTGEQIALHALNLGVGNNTLSASGQLDAQSVAMKYAIHATHLNAFYPDLRGSLTGDGTLTGTLAAPEIQARLNGNQIGFADNVINRLLVSLNTAMHDKGAFNNDIEARGVTVAGKHWDSVQLNTEGQYQAQQITLATQGGDYNARLAASGGFSAVDAWHGAVRTLQAQGKGVDWHLQKPFNLVASPQKVSVDDACLQDPYSAFCVSVDKEDTTHVVYDIQKIAARSFAEFIPEIVHINTALKGTGDLTLTNDGKITGQTRLTLDRGAIFVTPEDQPPLTLFIDQATITGDFHGDNANADVTLDFRRAGHFHLRSRIANFTDPSLRGNLTLEVPDIGIFRNFVPQVSELQGKVAGNLVFAGKATDPQITGNIDLTGGQVEVPAYATSLKDITLHIVSRAHNHIAIDGNIGTPQGALTAKGDLSLQPLTLNLNLDGENMLVANSEKIRVVVTPHFVITMAPKEGIHIDGTVVIPEANIAIPDTRSAQQPSDDIVIVRTGEKATPKEKTTPSLIYANIAVKLGDKVFYKDPNARIRLEGGITITMQPNSPIDAEGRISVASGVYELYGQELNIQRGWATFSGDVTQPSIDVLALRQVENVRAGAQVIGTPSNLRLTLTSDPAMPDTSILSYLLFGKAPDSATDSTALLQMAASIGTKGFFPDDLAQKTGLDVFDVGIGGVKAGKYLLKNIYVGLNSNFFTMVTRFLARYQITDRLSAEAYSQMQSGGDANSGQTNGVDLLYEFETN